MIMILSCLGTSMSMYTQGVLHGALPNMNSILPKCVKNTQASMCSIPIDGIFATSGIECVHAFLLPHLGGIGDHRCFIIALSSASMIGKSFPNIVQCGARKLHCSSKRMVNLYNAELTSLCNAHTMFKRMDNILCLTDYLSEEDFVLLMDVWDDKFHQYMLHSEIVCNIFMMGHIEWSPTIGIWLSHR